jgi:hypothetical protein
LQRGWCLRDKEPNPKDVPSKGLFGHFTTLPLPGSGVLDFTFSEENIRFGHFTIRGVPSGPRFSLCLANMQSFAVLIFLFCSLYLSIEFFVFIIDVSIAYTILINF